MTTSFPFLKIAKQNGMPYCTVVQIADRINKTAVWNSKCPLECLIASAVQVERARRVREIVFFNLDSARENGAFESGEQLDDADAEEIAADMSAYAADCESYEAAELIPYIKEWMEQRK